MSSSTALLPKNKKDDHPIFLRAAHSPWTKVNQQVLMFIRGIIAIYMLTAFIIVTDWEFKHNNHTWKTAPFELSNLAFLAQLIYQTITFIWTYMHLYYPHHASEEDNISTRLQRLFSPPKQNPETNNRFFFSLFYTSAIVYPHVVSLVYWSIIVPHRAQNHPTKPLFEQSGQKVFAIINLFIINSVVALVENFFLSSIRRQLPTWAHNVGLTVVSLIYIGWVYFGKLLTGRYAYWFLDPSIIGWGDVVANIIVLIALANIFFYVTYGITGFREMLTKKKDKQGGGYTRLPQ